MLSSTDWALHHALIAARRYIGDDHPDTISVMFNLSSLLQTEEGMATFEEAVKAEYSEENLAFWRATQAYAELDDEAARRRDEAAIARERAAARRLARGGLFGGLDALPLALLGGSAFGLGARRAHFFFLPFPFFFLGT